MTKARLLYVLLLFLSLHAYTEEGLIISEAWISEAPPSLKVNAGYFSIENNTIRAIELVNVSSKYYERIEIHRSIIVNDTVKMRPLSSISIEPQQRLEFSPGDYHLMLFKPVRAIKAGDKVDLEFTFSDDSTISLVADVRKLSTQHSHSHH